MDLDYLLHRHRVSLIMAERAVCARARAAHLGLAKGYAAAIATARFERRPERAA